MYATHKSSCTPGKRVLITITENAVRVECGTEDGNVTLTPSFGYLEFEVPQLTISTPRGALQAYRDTGADAAIAALRNAGWSVVTL